ncbi:hypothetical protein Asal01_02359 [Fodinibius salicampi]
MITESDRLALDYRDLGLWKEDIPTRCGGVENNRCSKCGIAFKNNVRITVCISNEAGNEHYDYHKECITSMLNRNESKI